MAFRKMTARSSSRIKKPAIQRKSFTSKTGGGTIGGSRGTRGGGASPTTRNIGGGRGVSPGRQQPVLTSKPGMQRPPTTRVVDRPQSKPGMQRPPTTRVVDRPQSKLTSRPSSRGRETLQRRSASIAGRGAIGGSRRTYGSLTKRRGR